MTRSALRSWQPWQRCPVKDRFTGMTTSTRRGSEPPTENGCKTTCRFALEPAANRKEWIAKIFWLSGGLPEPVAELEAEYQRPRARLGSFENRQIFSRLLVIRK
jgi:hypothetical protein